MPRNNSADKLADQQIREGPAKGAWIREQVKFEIERLNTVLRSPVATEEEKAIAQSQIVNYEEMAAIVLGPPPDWLRQMCFLAA